MTNAEQPQMSEDGKFYWDGQRWVPLPEAAVKKRWQDRQVASSGMVLIMLILIFGIGSAIAFGS